MARHHTALILVYLAVLLLAGLQALLTYLVCSASYNAASANSTAHPASGHWQLVVFVAIPIAFGIAQFLAMASFKRFGYTWAYRKTLIALLAFVITLVMINISMVIVVNQFGS